MLPVAYLPVFCPISFCLIFVFLQTKVYLDVEFANQLAHELASRQIHTLSRVTFGPGQLCLLEQIWKSLNCPHINPTSGNNKGNVKRL